MFDYFIVALIGLIGGITHVFVFKDGKFYPPKGFKDPKGRIYWDFGFINDLFVGIVAAFIATFPTWSIVPLSYKILPAIFASITGSSFVMSVSQNYLNKFKANKANELLNMIDDSEEEKNKKFGG